MKKPICNHCGKICVQVMLTIEIVLQIYEFVDGEIALDLSIDELYTQECIQKYCNSIFFTFTKKCLFRYKKFFKDIYRCMESAGIHQMIHIKNSNFLGLVYYLIITVTMKIIAPNNFINFWCSRYARETHYWSWSWWWL